nr:MAG TPA: hypothetical protein [Caudoviricetes sp.]
MYARQLITFLPKGCGTITHRSHRAPGVREVQGHAHGSALTML